ncbi:MAG: hypothetical protein QW272_08875 [Candidatus Methanomethylicaceae archaeon]
MGYVKTRKVHLIPEIEINYSKDHKEKRGSIEILLKNGFWSLNYVFKNLTYFLGGSGIRNLDINLDITNEALRIIDEKDEKTGKHYVKEVPDWLIRDYGTDFKVITHSINEIENAEELLEPKLIKRIVPGLFLEFYRKDKILKIPFFKDEIRINIENENLEYIRNNKKLIKAIPLNKEIHFYGIEPKVLRYIVTPEGAKLASTN